MNTAAFTDHLTEKEAAAFVGKKTEFYLRKWGEHPKSFYKGWNWAAFFFNVEWMAYRGMLLEAFIILAAIQILAWITTVLFGLANIEISVGMLDDIVMSAVTITIGFCGNALYYKKAVRILKKVKDKDERTRKKYLSERGGASFGGVIIISLVGVALYVFSQL